MTLDQCLLFWRLASGAATSIPPSTIFNNEFEDGLFKENAFGDWVLNKRHKQYRSYWCETFDSIARLLYTPNPFHHIYYLGFTADFRQWTSPAIDVLAVVANADAPTVARLQEVSMRLNQFLNGVPRSWKKNGVVPKVHLHIQNANEDWHCPKSSVPSLGPALDSLHVEDMRILVGNTAWFRHRNTLTGLLMEPKLARCYTLRWTSVAIDILLRGTHAHRIEFKRGWTLGLFPIDALENVCPGLPRFLHVNDSLNPEEQAWSNAVATFLERVSSIVPAAQEEQFDAFN